MKRVFVIFFSFILLPGIMGQPLKLEQCYEAAKNNYPLIKQYELIEKSKKYNLDYAVKAYLPQLSLNAAASWQSDITEFPESFTTLIDRLGIDDISFPDHDRYQVVLDLYQSLWDGGVTEYRRKLIKARTEVEKQNLEINLYTLYSRINDLYFGILLLNEQLIQNELLNKELQRNCDRVESLVAQGVANEQDVHKIKVEMLNREQVESEMKSTKKIFMMALSLFIGQELNDSTEFERPAPLSLENYHGIRPELSLFEIQNRQFDVQKKGLYSKGMPRIGLFAQGAYANPGLNMFESEFSPYFIGGIRLSWQFGALYTLNDEQKEIENNKNAVAIQKELFLFNQKQTLLKYQTEIEKTRQLIQKDEEIIVLREKILLMSEVKTENGTLSMNDFLQDVLLTDAARQNKAIHEMQLLRSMYQYKIESGF